MRLTQFRVQNYRSVASTDWIDVGSMTAFVGQNEAGKSNLCEALYILNPMTPAKYNVDEDWPVDDWGNKNRKALVCEARFHVEEEEQEGLLEAAGLMWSPPAVQAGPEDTFETPSQPPGTYRKDQLPLPLLLRVGKDYGNVRRFHIESSNAASMRFVIWSEPSRGRSSSLI